VPALASARNPIDAFIRARLAKEGLQPSPAADRRTLLRRVTLDLTGLAPEPAQIEAFVKDKSADASEKVVDRLLASQAYAEHQAVPWLDAVSSILRTGPLRSSEVAHLYIDSLP